MKILTAMDDMQFNMKLKKELPNEEIMIDISYLDGIIEMLKSNSDIDIIIISENIINKDKFPEIIKKVKEVNNKIQIYVFLLKDNLTFRKILISYGIEQIFLNNEISIKQLARIIKRDINIKNKELLKELNELKSKVFELENTNNLHLYNPNNGNFKVLKDLRFQNLISKISKRINFKIFLNKNNNKNKNKNKSKNKSKNIQNLIKVNNKTETINRSYNISLKEEKRIKKEIKKEIIKNFKKNEILKLKQKFELIDLMFKEN